MNKEFVPYEEALALKELGFDEDCFGLYNSDFKDNVIETKILGVQNNFNTNIIVAPLYQQAFRWFRSKGFCIMDRPFYDSKANPKITYAKDIIRWFDGKVWKGFKENSYEEAELACLRKLIEIVKNQSNENIQTKKKKT